MSDAEVAGLHNRPDRRALEAGHEPLAVPMTRVPDWLGISRSKAYEEIAAGRLRAVKCGSKTLVPYAPGEAWLNGLPALAA
jgi:excisionase family DNA binding protein